MEIKHLFLLMTVPVILIGLVIYAGSVVQITGFAVKESKESNSLGVYSINPSFKTRIDYSLDDYARIKEKLDSIIKCALDGKDIETCLSEVNKDISLTWQLNCDKGAEKVLYDFAEFMQSCIDSDDNNCLCRKTMEISKDDLQGYLPPTNEYSFVLTEDVPYKKINIELPNSEFSYSLDSKGLSGWIPSRYSLGYSLGGLPTFNIFFPNKEPGEKFYTFGPTQQIEIYKNQLRNNIKSIDFVNKEEDALIYPNGDIVKENEKQINANEIRECRLKPKNIYKFCVTQNNYEVVAFDRLDRQIKERNPVIKFASYVPDLPPAPLKNLEAGDRPKSEKTILLKWDKSDEKDISKFRIYYADSSLKALEKPIGDIKKNPDVPSREIAARAIEISAPFNLAECEFDFSGKRCLFPAYIENDKLYYSSFFNAYVYSLNVPEDKKTYDFSVTAIDKNNNEIDNIKSKIPVKSIQSIDDLAPSSENLVSFNVVISYDIPTKKARFNFGEKPLKNIDGTSLINFNSYKVYYLKYDSLAQGEKTKEISKILDGKLKNLKFLANVNYEEKGQPFFVDLSATNPAGSNLYLFVIVATDANGNPKEEQYKPKELGTQVLQLAIS